MIISTSGWVFCNLFLSSSFLFLLYSLFSLLLFFPFYLHSNLQKSLFAKSLSFCTNFLHFFFIFVQDLEINEYFDLTGSWPSKQDSIKAPILVEGLMDPQEFENLDLEEFPLGDFQSKLMEVDLDLLQ